MMRKHDQLRDRRLSLGLEKCEVASYAGLTIHEYDDLETYEDELFTVVPVFKILKVCRLLKLDTTLLLGIEKSADGVQKGIIGQKMKERNITIPVLSDMVGVAE